MCDINILISRSTQFLANTFTFAICYRPSVCLSVTFVRPTQAIEIFRNISTPFGMMANLLTSR